MTAEPVPAAEYVACLGVGQRGVRERGNESFYLPCPACGVWLLPRFGGYMPDHTRAVSGGAGRLGSAPADIGAGSGVRFPGVVNPPLPEQPGTQSDGGVATSWSRTSSNLGVGEAARNDGDVATSSRSTSSKLVDESGAPNDGSKCVVNESSSRACEMGTRGCDIQHG